VTQAPSSPSSDIVFIQRTFPSANIVLIKGDAPVLIDSGYGSDLDDTIALVRSHGVEPESLSHIVNSHYHSDHVGGNHGFQARYGTKITGHAWEAAMINNRDPEACSASWLDQPVEPYRVSKTVRDGDSIDTGAVQLRVIHTPGHTVGHISFIDEASGSLICGDALHADDVCWLNPFQEGAGVLERAIDSIEKLAALKPKWSCSGHGPSTVAPGDAFKNALARYSGWREDATRVAWHACKRIFAFRLMIVDGVSRFDVDGYLMECAWYQDYCVHMFEREPESFIAEFMDEMIRSKAARWDGDRLVAGAPYTVPASNWQKASGTLKDWPRIEDEVNHSGD